MENTRENWLKLLAALPPEAEIALEVSTSGHFVMSVLEEAGWRERSHWVHTAGIDSLKKQKYDRLDAKRLARKLSVADRDPLPEAWFPPAPIRELRLEARQRCSLVRMRTQSKNRVRSLLQRYGLRPASNPFSEAGRAWLERVAQSLRFSNSAAVGFQIRAAAAEWPKPPLFGGVETPSFRFGRKTHKKSRLPGRRRRTE